MRALTPHGKFIVYGFSSAVLVFVVGTALSLSRCSRREAHADNVPAIDVPAPGPEQIVAVRDIPKDFPANSHLPRIGEGAASGSIDRGTFSAGRDLIYFDDDRIWWESDNDDSTGDTECDHSIHHALGTPLSRLVELVGRAGGTLEVHDAYRPTGVHAPRSLHLEGRAVDVTCDELGLKELAKLCWAAGFDWVYYEAKARGGAHVHASVRRDNGEAPPDDAVASDSN